MYPTADRPHFGIFVREQVESLRALGVEIDVLFMNGKESKLNYLRAFTRLWKQLDKRDYDLVHAHYILAGVVARAQRRVPVVLTHHGPEVFMTWQAWVSRALTGSFESVIVVSREMKTKLGAANAHVIPCGVDMERFQPRPMEECRRELGLPLDKRLVLWAGEHTRPEKRFELVQQAMDRLRSVRPEVELVLLSNKPHDVVPAYMNACDTLVLTSDAEGSPMVVKEAMACNLPVVSTAAGDVAEVIGRTAGCYVTRQNPTEIAWKLSLALERGARTEGRSAVGYLGLDSIGERVLAVYKQTIAASKRAQAPVVAKETRT
jgi:glycosyltransferase involved in cell wall biosynthesis